MDALCAQCRICEGLGVPKQRDERVLVYRVHPGEERARVLVIDQLETGFVPVLTLMKLFGADVPVDYTNAVRCQFDNESMETAEWNPIVAHCSVWTNSLLADRSIILSTPRGFYQMGMLEKWSFGKVYKSSAYGMLLCTRPLLNMKEEDVAVLKTKVERMLHGATT